MPSWSGLFNDVQNENYVIPFSDASQQTRPSFWYNLSRLSNRKDAELLKTLIGATAGSAAADSYIRSEPTTNDDERGGVKAIETVSVIARNTTSADVTALNAKLFPVRQLSYPTNLAGTGKVGNGWFSN